MESVKGLKKLLSTLEKIPNEMEKDVEAVLEANAQEIEAEAKRMAPVDTGRLRQSIKAIKVGKLTFKIMANSTGLAPYAVYVEYGTRFQRSQPFLFPAFFRGRKNFTKDLQNLLDNTFGKI